MLALATVGSLLLNGLQAHSLRVALGSSLDRWHPLTFTLDLSDKGITAITEEEGQLLVSNYSSLRKLDLSGNQLTRLPASIGGLSTLIGLMLSDNHLTSLPKEIGNLSRLKYLWLSGNQLTRLPAQTGGLTKLVGLVLKRNRLVNLPGAIGNLTSLTKLGLSDNLLTSLPEEINRLTNLEVLDLSSNRLNPQEVARVRTALPQATIRAQNQQLVRTVTRENAPPQVISRVCRQNMLTRPAERGRAQ